MAILFTDPVGGLEHTSGVLPLDGDFTWMGWFTPTVENTSGGYRNYWAIYDAGYNNYVEIASSSTGGPNIDVYGATFSSEFTLTTEQTALIDDAYHVCVTYDISASTLKYYINGALVYTALSVDFTGVTSTNEVLGYDGFASVTDLATQNARAWIGQVLTAAQIPVEMQSNTAVFTTGLFYDTPLTNASDLASLSGSAGSDGNWSNIAGAGTDYTTYDVKFITSTANSSFASALVIPYLPYKLIQNANPSGTAITYYYKINAISNVMIGAWAWSANNSYGPEASPYSSTEVQILGISSRRKPFQFLAESGEFYYIKALPLSSNPIPGINYLQLSKGDDIDSANGDLIVPSDTDGFPVNIVRANGDIGQKVPFVAGEQGDAIDNGTALMADIVTTNTPIHISNANLIETGTITSIPGDKFIRAQPADDLFYVSVETGGNTTVYVIDQFGVVDPVNYSLGAVSIGSPGSNGAICGDVGRHYLYYTDADYNVNRWNLDTDSFDLIFTPAVTNFLVTDILVLSNGNIIILYYKDPNVGQELYAEEYDADQNLLRTFSFGTNIGVFAPRLSYSENNPSDFWVWINFGDPEGKTEFQRVQVSDGTILETRTAWQYKEGKYFGSVTPTPGALIGIDPSCPFWQLRTTTTLTIVKIVVGGPDGVSFDFTTTGGLDPDTFSLEDGDSQVYGSLDPGTYGVTETPNSDYTTTYEVSNGDPHTAIDIGSDDSVTVTVTNTFIGHNPLSGIYKIIPWSRKPNDTLYTSLDPVETENVKIPDPYADTGLLGK